MPDIVCDVPEALSHDKAREVFKAVKKEMPGLQESQYRREAARRLGLDYETYLAAWKKPGLVRPKPGAPKAPSTLDNAPEPKPPVHTEPPVPSPVSTPERRKPLRTSNESDDPRFGAKVLRGPNHVGYVRKVDTQVPQFAPNTTTVVGFKRRVEWQVRDADGKMVYGFATSRKEALERLDRILVTRARQGIPEGRSQVARQQTLRDRLGAPARPTVPDADLSGFQRRPLSPSVADDYDHMDLTDRGIQALADTRSTNPLYGTNNVAYGMNCVHVVQAHELRRRGWDVVASRLPKEFGRSGRNAQQAIQDAWRRPDGSRPVMIPGYASTLEATLLRQLPDGGRAWVVNTWTRKNGGGHIFNVERVGNEIRVYEAQSGSMKTLAEYMGRSKPDVYWLRTDELVPTEKVMEFLDDGPKVRQKRDAADAKRKAAQEAKLADIYWRSRHDGESEFDYNLRMSSQPTRPASWDWRAYEQKRRERFAAEAAAKREAESTTTKSWWSAG